MDLIKSTKISYRNVKSTLSCESSDTLLRVIVPTAPYFDKYSTLPDDSDFYHLVKEYESEGYKHIVSKVCSSFTPFYSIDVCCYACREGFNCIESKTHVYIWFWKPILASDEWVEQEKLIRPRK